MYNNDKTDDNNTDHNLMAELKRGIPSAFDKILDRYEKRIINLAYRYTGNREKAEDIAQEVFVKVYNAREIYKPSGKFSAWILKITVNICLNELRRNKVNKLFSQSKAPDDDEDGCDLIVNYPDPSKLSPESLLIQNEISEKVKKAVLFLPYKQRMVVILSKFEGMDYRETADIMGTTVTSVKLRFNRAKKTLIKKLSHLR